MWMWIVGGACGLIVLLIAAIGGFLLSSISKLKDEIKLFRIEFAESKGERITWPQFTEVKAGMEKDRGVDIKLALSEHVETHYHGIKAS